MTPLPMTLTEMQERGWDELDFLFVSGDAYVDHPSFGTAVIGRLLEREGFRIGIIAQPSLVDPSSLLILGRPRLGVLVSSGVVDSMVNHYTAALKPRSDDSYSPGGRSGRRPERALIRYCNLVRQQLGPVPLIIGGVEASLRRFAHYDFWDNTVRRSILQDSGADLLVYGMGERAIIQIARLLDRGVPIRKIQTIRGTCILSRRDNLPPRLSAWLADQPDPARDFAGLDRTAVLGQPFPENELFILLPGYAAVAADRRLYAAAFRLQYREQAPLDGKTLIQSHGDRFLIQNPPQMPLSTQELDRIFALPFTRRAHPSYAASGGVPASEEVRFSINSHRGCYGGCHFCAITFLQGRIVTRRSDASILAEARMLVQDPDFKGYIHDLGGPTANFFEPGCTRQEKGQICKDRACLTPEPCPLLRTDHTSYREILRQVRQIPGVKKVFIRSGIRFDTILLDRKSGILEEICRYHVSGQLKVAPEHISRNALAAMGKPGPEAYVRFREAFTRINRELGKKQYLVPYLISGHPGTTLADAIELAQFLKAGRVMPEQVQDFYPTPGTISTAMYYTGLNPLTFEPVHVPDREEKRLQRALLQFANPKNEALVRKALHLAGRTDLIGSGPECLLQETRPGRTGQSASKNVINTEDKKHDHNHQGERTRRQDAPSARRKRASDIRTNRPSTGTGRHSGR